MVDVALVSEEIFPYPSWGTKDWKWSAIPNPVIAIHVRSRMVEHGVHESY